MKKLILSIVILFLFLFSCQKPRLGSWNDPEITGSNPTSYDGGEIKSIIYDSCEYIIYSRQGSVTIAHKGNCKYCSKRKNLISGEK